MASTTFLLCMAVLTQLAFANTTGRTRRERPTIPTEGTSSSMLVICSPDEGCFSQYGDQVNCVGVDVTHRVVFLRTVENRGEPGAFYVYQQFSLPNSLFRPRNFESVIQDVNARANPGAPSGAQPQPAAQPVAPPAQPAGQPFGPAAQPVTPTLGVSARTGLFAAPVTQPPTTQPAATRPSLGAGATGFTAPQRPVCRIQFLAAFGSPFGLCCGPCRY